MKGEPKAVKAKLSRLAKSSIMRFPIAGKKLAAPDIQGVYVIYDPNGRVAHVGRTVRGKRGLYQRLNNHLHGRSSFVIKALNGKGATLRNGYKFRFIAVEESRLRALLEAFAIGQLCPDHLGDGGS
jgi:excinuclease UvrABC nuclease subunit